MPGLMAMILSGGDGEAMSVLTAERTVSAVPFGGKYRVIDFVLSNCRHSDVHRVGILTQHNPASLHDHIGAGRAWDLDRLGGGVIILQPYLTRSQAAWYRGTAHALASNWDVIEHHAPNHVLVLSGDQVYRMDYRSILRAHLQRDAVLTLGVTRVQAAHSRRFGMVTLDHEGRILSLDEKPDHAETPFASMGVYLFDYETLGEVLRAQPVDLALDVLRPLLASGQPVFAHEFSGYWEDVGTVGSYYGATMELLAPEPRLALHDPRWPILTRDEERAPVLLLDHAVAEDSLIANGCTVAGTVRRSVLSPGVWVDAGATITDSVVMSDCRIGPGARIERAILDKYVQVGEGAVIGAGAAAQRPACAWLDGLTLVGKDARVPPGVEIGKSCVVGLGASAEEISAAKIPAGTRVPDRPWLKDVS